MKYEWEQLLLEYAKIIFKYLIKIGAAKEDAEDITQETIVKTFVDLLSSQLFALFRILLHLLAEKLIPIYTIDVLN